MLYGFGAVWGFIFLVLVRGLFCFFRKPLASDLREVICPRFWLGFSLIFTGMFFVLSVVTFAFGAMVAGGILGVVALVGCYMVVSCCNRKICYDDASFTITDFFGRKHCFHYEDVTYFSEILICFKIHTVDQSVAIGFFLWFSPNMDDFMDLVRRRYRGNNDGKSVPYKSKSRPAKPRPYFENVRFPETHIFFYVLLLGIFLLLTIGIGLDIISPTEPKEFARSLEYKTIEVEDYGVQFEFSCFDFPLRIYTEDNSYRLLYYDELLRNRDAFFAACDAGVKFDIGYYYYGGGYQSGPSDNYLYRIIGADGTVYLSIEDVRARDREANIKIWIFFALCLVIVVACVMFSVCIGRHPERYHPDVVRIFYRKGEIYLPGEPRAKQKKRRKKRK